MFALALTALSLAAIPQEYVQQSPMDHRVEEAISYFLNNLSHQITVETVASEIGTSKGTLTRLFKKETGSSLYNYLMELRISWACDLLIQDSMSIDEIAESTGFTDRFHFSKVFKQWIGVPPGAYRIQDT